MSNNLAPDRNEFVDPLPQDQSTATLLIDGQRLPCRLTEVSINGFSVVVSRATTFRGEPIGRLVTHDNSYKVQLMTQEARYDGYLVSLVRLEESPDELLTKPQKWIIYASRCCTIGLVLALAYNFLLGPGAEAMGPAPKSILPEFVTEWTDFGSVRREPKGSENPSLANDQSPDRAETGSDPASPHAIDRRLLINDALTLDSRLARPLNSSTLPWLFSKGNSVRLPLRCRMATSAESDLMTFENCLQSLPKSVAAEATKSLRDTIVKITNSPIAAVSVLPDVRVAYSEDAEVYFRVVQGVPELLRVIPVEFEDTGTLRLPSASANHHPRRH